jgi:membrane-bound metal-dependent hydrolase YbcI (DUF457 family)
MPFTPFHFGPAAVVKALIPRSFSLTAFVASQVLIDLESGYHLLRHEWPVHRVAHTLPVATAIGVLSGTLVYVAGRWFRPSARVEAHAELRPLAAHVGGLVGGLSHPLLDGIMHADIRPFWPISDANPLLGTVDLMTLHVACLASGVVGIGLLAARLLARRLTEGNRPP